MHNKLKIFLLNWPVLVAIMGMGIAAFGIYCGWSLFPSRVHQRIEENVILKRDSEQLERFLRLPQPLTFKVYAFNVTNPNEVQQGALPIVQEIGPYVYNEYRSNQIKHFSQDGSKITYIQDQLYLFDAEASAPLKETDQIIILNMHLNAFLEIFENEITDILQGFANRINYRLNRTPGVRILKRLMDRIRGKRKSILQVAEMEITLSFFMSQLNYNIAEIFNQPKGMFLKTTIKEYFFDGVRFCIDPSGFARTICRQIKQNGAKSLRQMPDGSLAFSLFHHKNGTNREVFEVHTGKGDTTKLGQILKLDDAQYLDVWLNDEQPSQSSTCNQINGTDGSIFAPFRYKGDTIYIFSADICRSAQLFYEDEVIYKDITGYRYSIGENFINDIGTEYNNHCYCINKLTNIIKRKNGCLYSGALDLTNCVGAPVILTLPHMLGASKEYTKTVKGLKADAQKHRMFIDIEPMTGLPLQGGKKVQFNMFLKRITNIQITENLPTVLMPVVWVDEGIRLNDELAQLLRRKLNNIKILHSFYWITICTGLIITKVSLIYFICKRHKSASKRIQQ